MINLVECIHRSVGYIEDHLHQPVTVSDMADAAGYSVFHFIRSFNQVVKHTPYDYLMRRRLSRAENDLVSSSRRIIDIAQDYCIGSQESFTRLFRKMFDQTPGQCRAAGGVPWWKILQPKTLEDLYFSSQLAPVDIVLTGMDTIRLKGLMSRMDDGLNGRGAVRAALAADLAKMLPPQTNIQQFEIWSGFSPQRAPGYCFLGFLMSDVENHSAPLVEQALDGARMVEVGIHPGQEVCAARFLLSSWMPTRDLQPSMPLSLIIRKGGINRKESLFIKVEEIAAAGKRKEKFA